METRVLCHVAWRRPRVIREMRKMENGEALPSIMELTHVLKLTVYTTVLSCLDDCWVPRTGVRVSQSTAGIQADTKTQSLQWFTAL